MMKTETKVIHRNGIRFLDQNYYNEALFGLREQVYIRYSLFDLSKVFVYSIKGEFICTAKQVEKIHPMANYLGTVKDMEDFKQKIQKHKRLKNKAIKDFKKYFDIETTGILEIPKEVSQIEEFKEEKRKRAEGESDSDTRLMRVSKTPKRERKKTPREQQMNKPIFNHDYEKYEWLMAHGTTNSEDRKWLENYIKSEEYENLYGG